MPKLESERGNGERSGLSFFLKLWCSMLGDGQMYIMMCGEGWLKQDLVVEWKECGGECWRTRVLFVDWSVECFTSFYE